MIETKNSCKNLSIFNKNILNKYNIPKNSIFIYGQHACKSAIENKNREKILILTTKRKLEFWEKITFENKLSIEIVTVAEKILDLFSKNNVHQNVILIAKHLRKIKLSEYLDQNKSNKNKIILLDQLSDPQNIGSIIRSAFAFGFNAVGMLKNNSPFETSALIKASSGEIEKITLIELGNLINEINLLKQKGFFVYGLANEGHKNIKNAKINDQKLALVIGSEGKGLRSLTKKNLDEVFYIHIDKNCNSLNASNAAAIAMFELGN